MLSLHKAASGVPTAERNRDVRSVLSVVALLVLAGVAGLLGGLPIGLALVVVGFMAAVALVSMVRMVFASPLSAGIPALHEPTRAAAASSILRFPRLLYYGGVLSMAQLTFRLPLNFTLSDWLFFAALGLTVLELLAFHRRLVIALPILVLLGALIFALGSLFSSLRAEHPVQSLAVATRFIYMVTAWFWLGSTLLREPAHVKTAVRLWTLSAAITGAGAVAQLMWGDVIPRTTPSWGRMTGFTPHMIDLGGVTSLALVPALWVAAQPNALGFQKVVSFASVLLIGAGIALSGSVGGLLAAAVAVVLWLVFAAIRLRTIFIAAVLVGLGAILGLGILEQAGSISPVARVQRVTESQGEEGSLWTRVEGYRAAWEVIGSNPFIGVGLDDESSRVDVTGLELLPDGTAVFARHQVHNVLLGAWYGAGLLGLLGVLAILVAMQRIGVSAVLRASTRDERFLTAALLASYGGFVVFALGTVVLYQRYGWIGAALLLAVWTQQTRRAEKVGQDADPESDQ